MISTFHYSLPNLHHHVENEDLVENFNQEVAILLAEALEARLQTLLEALEETISQCRRKDWPAIALALCTLLFGLESMQVDIHLQSSEAKSICSSMEDRAILMLTEIFSSSTTGFKPLGLDWEKAENIALVDYDMQAVDALRGLQEVSQEYCKKIISSCGTNVR